MSSKVSVIVPCYNQGQYLAECLESVLSQSYQDWECIIVNDESSDKTEEVARRFCAIDPRFVYIHTQENQGVSYSRNKGIENSKGEYILPLDGDDKIGDTYLEKAVHCFSNNPNLKLVYCIAMKFGRKSGIYNLPPYKYEQMIWGNQIFCSAVFKRSDFNMTEGYNINMKEGLEDWDFWLSLLKPEDEVYQIPEVLFYYRMKSDSRGHGSVRHMNNLLIQVYHNHKDIYAPYAERIIEYHYKLLKLDAFERENLYIKNSLSYKIGLFISRPIRIIKKHLKK